MTPPMSPVPSNPATPKTIPPVSPVLSTQPAIWDTSAPDHSATMATAPAPATKPKKPSSQVFKATKSNEAIAAMFEHLTLNPPVMDDKCKTIAKWGGLAEHINNNHNIQIT